MSNLRTLQEIKDSIENRISNSANNPLPLEEALEIIKISVEDVILFSGETGKKSLITSQQLINLLHEVVKSSLITNSINPILINPLLVKQMAKKLLRVS